MPNPIVSVVMTAHKHERFVATAIESVLTQTFQDFELLVTDGGLTDQSVAVCQTFSDSRIRIISTETSGPGAARNAGIREARGRYVAFLDAGDAWMPDKLTRHVDHLDSLPEVGVSYSYSAFIDETGERLGHYRTIGASPTSVELCLMRNPVGNDSNAVLRTEVFDPDHPRSQGRNVDHFFFDEELQQGEGFELWVRVASQTGWRLDCIPLPLTLCRVWTEGPSEDIRAKRGYHYLALVKIHDYAPEVVAGQRTASIAYLYRQLAGVLLRKGDSQQAFEYCRVARRFDAAAFGTEGFLLIVAAVLQRVLHPHIYAAAERLALRMLGKMQERSMEQGKRS